MFPVATIVAKAHIDDLLADAAAERLARSAKASSQAPSRIADALKSVWSTLSGPAERPITPTLVNYPFKG
jgi:hypothetical protein